MSAVRTVPVPLDGRGYDVLVGRGARAELASLVPRSARRAVVVTQAGIPIEVDPGVPCQTVVIGDGEEHKRLATIEVLCDRFAEIGITRNDVVIGVGGGMVTDVAGFAASVWHRGVPVVHVATTLLGMVDAAIGGKTGVNAAAGKNLIGAFWQPSGVVCDLDALDTLPPRELRCGRGEMAKYHFLTGDDLLALDVVDRVARCVAIKAEVVAGDERESTDRRRGGRSSTTGTRSPTRSRSRPATASPMVRRSRSAWSTPLASPGDSAASTRHGCSSTSTSWAVRTSSARACLRASTTSTSWR
jgi:5-deoxy-5-amino-3-dehydroquinate synthase